MVGLGPHPPTRTRRASRANKMCASWWRWAGLFRPRCCLRTKLAMLRFTGLLRRFANRSRPAWLALFLCLPLVQSGPVKAASSSEDALRARVAQCYSALEQGDWKKAEKYLTKESKLTFRSQTRKPLLGYQIDSIKIDADGRSATVVVRFPIVSAATPRPILVPRPTLWRLVSHTWYLDLSRPNPSDQQAMFGATPTTGMPNAVPPIPAPPKVPAPFGYAKDLKFESTWSGLGRVKGDAVKTARFAFTNVGTRVVTLAEFQLGCDCLRLKTQKLEYKPGESGTLEIEFDASKLHYSRTQSFQQDIVFKAEPSDAYVKLTVAALLLGPDSTIPPTP